MAYRVRWKLVGRNGRRLDEGGIDQIYRAYPEAAAAINELLRPYPEVLHVAHEGYWLARRSDDADLAVWVWIELAEAVTPSEDESRAETAG
jgi:hypothetical protein